MKRGAIIALALGVLTAYAQPPTQQQPFESQLNQRLNIDRYRSAEEAQPNEIVHGKISYSGIAVEVLKTGRPLQLINPFAPAKYGSPGDNVLRDPITKKVRGWKLFSINF
jgi:hypothetical protein